MSTTDLLLVLYMLRLCYCGDDDQISISKRSTCSKPEDRLILDLDTINPSAKDVYEYHYDGNHLFLVYPQCNVSVTIVHSGSLVWASKPGETLLYCKLYLKNCLPNFAVITVMTASIKSSVALERVSSRWIRYRGSYKEQLEALKVRVEKRGDFSINLKDSKDTDNCTIFEAKTLGLPTRHFYPKQGYHATEVMDNEVSIWQASECTDERCLSCEIYLEDSIPSLMLMIVKRLCGKESLYFEKLDGKWRETTEQEFVQKRLKLGESSPFFRGHSSGVAKRVPVAASSKSGRWISTLKNKIINAFKPPLPSPKAVSSGSSVASTLSISSDDEDGWEYASVQEEGQEHADKVGRVIDLEVPNDAVYTSLDCFFDNVPIKQVVPNEHANIIMVVIGQCVLWTPNGEEKLGCVKIYLKDGKPKIILVVFQRSEGTFRTYYKLKRNKWKESRKNYGKKIQLLKVFSAHNGDAVIRLDEREKTTEYGTYELPFMGYNIRSYYPNPGYEIVKVIDGEDVVWEVDLFRNNKCLSCNIYLMNGVSRLLSMGVLGFPKPTYSYWEKKEGKWVQISPDEYADKKELLKREYSQI